jgi:arylsulfatase
VPQDRLIDGVDQLDFLTGAKARSNREGFPIFQTGEPTAVKWRNWKYYVVLRESSDATAVRLDKPQLFNLLWDPKEETPRNLELEDSWVLPKLREILAEARASLVTHPPVPAGAKDPYVPPSGVN